MCGIVGIANWEGSAIMQSQLGTFMQMLLCDSVRGMHGTGMFAVDKEGSNFRLRVGGPPHQLVASSDFEKMETFVQQKYVRFLVGHNRYATRGKIVTEHSHPFRDGQIILVHNGTLDSFHHLPDAKNYDVDSEALCHAISTWGADKTIPTLKGAWALVWYDGSNKTLNFLRNKERPLWIGRHKKDKMIAFASEFGMLDWILGRNGVYEIEIKELPENQWLSFPLEGSGKPHVKELKGKSDKGSKEGQWSGWGKSMRQDTLGIETNGIEAKAEVIPFVPKKTFSNVSHTHSKASDNRGSLPVTKKQNSGSAAGRGYWVAADSIHTISKTDPVIIWPLDYRAIDTDKAKEKGLFMIQGMVEGFPDVDFFCHVAGIQNVQTLMDAPHGIRANIKSILRSMNTTARFPHQVYLKDPEPMFVEEPEIPEHAKQA